jgi:kinesin family member 6/9
MEDESGSIHLKNLSMYMSATEEEALNYLFLGDTNRAISETAMNKASSRSHCIFTVSIEGRKAGGDKVTRSKLHLVDLAGSERVHKTNATGQTLQEAKYINTSLFYLEMVIVALHDKAKGRRHVPYRNSMMTSVLRDSLGGNCKTVMIATINPESAHTEESISTCRFAQRVSLIKNVAVVNEDLDPLLMIRRLKGEVAALQDEVAYLKGESGEGAILNAEERASLEQACTVYVNHADPAQQLNIGAYTMTKIRDCFAVLRNMVLEARARNNSSSGNGTGSGSSDNSNNAILSLKMALQERDAEIAILVNMVKQGTTAPAMTIATAAQSGSNGNSAMNNANSSSNGDWQKAKLAAAAKRDTDKNKAESAIPCPKDHSILDDPQKALSYYREYYPPNTAIEENKAILQQKYTKAKTMGARVNQARSTITYLKSTIEQIRRERAMEGLMDSDSSSKADDNSTTDNNTDEDAAAADADEAKYKLAIEEEKKVYKDSFQELRELKTEIENIQKLLEKARCRMQAEFEAWYESLVSELECSATITTADSIDSESIGVAPRSTAGRSDRTTVSAYSQPKSVTSQRSSSSSSTGTVNYGAKSSGHQQAWTDSSHHANNNSSTTNSNSGYAAAESKESSMNSTSISGGGSSRVPQLRSGDKEVDDDIIAFYKAKEELQQRRNSNRNSAQAVPQQRRA